MGTLVALPETVRGLPLHVLIVHAVVVLVPLAALAALGSALWPAVRRYFGATAVVVAAVATLLVPVATGSGKNLERRLGAEELVHDHARWAGRMLPAMIFLLVTVLALVLLDIVTRAAQVTARPVAVGVGGRGDDEPSRSDAPGASAGFDRWGSTPPLTFLDRRVASLMPAGLAPAAAAGRLRVANLVLTVLVVLAALIALYICFRTGESGARAAWGGR